MDEVTVRSMNGGIGRYSYTKNSALQRKFIEDTKESIKKVVEEHGNQILSSSKAIKIADLGCSTGPNTLLAVQNIIDAFEHKFRLWSQEKDNNDPNESETNNIPEFQVFFNDLASNDFDQLFESLPRDRKYFAAGVPGSFHGPLFLKDSMHFVHSSGSVHWLSRVPKEMVDKSSPAWNKGRVFYSNSTDKVVRAYEEQFAKDMDTFLKFRAQEIVHGGLMALLTYGRSSGSSHSDHYLSKVTEQVGHALIDMAKEGKVSDEKIDSFNIPMYFASPEEVESAVKRSGCFNMETMEIVPRETPQPNVISSIYRAVFEGMIKQHFGDDILDELFDTVLLKKLQDLSARFDSFQFICIFVTLKIVKY